MFKQFFDLCDQLVLFIWAQTYNVIEKVKAPSYPINHWSKRAFTPTEREAKDPTKDCQQGCEQGKNMFGLSQQEIIHEQPKAVLNPNQAMKRAY